MRMIMERCDSYNRSQCPHASYCETFSVYADEDECIKLKLNVVNKPKTNADSIRAMSDEELAELVAKYVYCGLCPLKHRCIPGECKKVVMKWLKQPAGQ